MSWGIEVISAPTKLVIDELAIAREMADEALHILTASGRVPVRSGSFLESHRVIVDSSGVSIAPTGARNEIIARVQLAKGNDLYAFTAAEVASIVTAGQREFDRQVASGRAALE